MYITHRKDADDIERALKQKHEKSNQTQPKASLTIQNNNNN